MSEETKSHMQSVSESFRSRTGINDEGVKEQPEQAVQAMNASEHAGGHDADGNPREPVEPPEATVPNTVNEGAETAAATTPAGESQSDSGQEDPTVISGDGGDDES